MKKEKYVYNPLTLRYDKVEVPVKARIIKGIGYFCAVVMAGFLLNTATRRGRGCAWRHRFVEPTCGKTAYTATKSRSCKQGVFQCLLTKERGNRGWDTDRGDTSVR